MKLIRPYVEIWEQGSGIEGMLRHIERCTRVCYKSEDKIGEGTAERMVEMLKKNEHTAMLEHGTIYLEIVWDIGRDKIAEKYSHNKYSKMKRVLDESSLCPVYYITTNYRVLVENGWLEDLKYLCEPTEHHEKRITVHFGCDRAIMAELTRHRIFSFAVESTRYCNYSKDKFCKEVTFIIPCWMDNIPNNSCYLYDTSIEDWQKKEDANTSNFLQCIAWAEKNYLTLLHNGWTPQQARSVLPNALKTEVCMTGFVSDWEHFFKLRCDKAAHPQMRELAIPLQKLIMQ